ncbi:hypothetical protein CAPN002_00160 [Capnocytophaga stomatis]|uniref:hypothetical protein n=1 Tax=Capnocytophaga stomatis TaxID=1848904 RepID=UPI00194DF17B|nr:hypothetical protein [Capnocytophaga stomatis]GIJ92798.1 hypothetical protein CAPN002_00160 [Capnocytophaga stomatis]
MNSIKKLQIFTRKYESVIAGYINTPTEDLVLFLTFDIIRETQDLIENFEKENGVFLKKKINNIMYYRRILVQFVAVTKMFSKEKRMIKKMISDLDKISILEFKK